MIRRKRALQTVLFLLIFFSTWSGLQFLVFQVVKHRSGMEIQGQWLPKFISPGFYVNDAVMTWDQKATIKAPQVEVSYRFLRAVLKQEFELRIFSRKADINLKGGLENLQGLQAGKLDKLLLEITIGKKNITEIKTVDIHGPSINFQIKSAN